MLPFGYWLYAAGVVIAAVVLTDTRAMLSNVDWPVSKVG